MLHSHHIGERFIPRLALWKLRLQSVESSAKVSATILPSATCSVKPSGVSLLVSRGISSSSNQASLGTIQRVACSQVDGVLYRFNSVPDIPIHG